MSGRDDAPPDRMWAVGLALVFSTAFLARLVPLLNGGGLYAMGNYDDGVHYAVAMGCCRTGTSSSCTRLA
jgi:hypothetical protein